jgi:hypothetical protein
MFFESHITTVISKSTSPHSPPNVWDRRLQEKSYAQFERMGSLRRYCYLSLRLGPLPKFRFELLPLSSSTKGTKVLFRGRTSELRRMYI